MINESLLNKCREYAYALGSDENLEFPHSLPICILDAVFSIGIKYTIARNVWIRYIDYYKLNIGKMKEFENGLVDINEHTIDDFISNVEKFTNIEEFIEKVIKSRNRTSSTNGILKAEAAYEVAKIMSKNIINTINDFRCFRDKEKLDCELKSVKGQSSGIMVGYLYMLAGDTALVKPDRWLFRFIQKYEPEIKNSEQLQSIIEEIVGLLKTDIPNLTVRMLDNAIWKFEREDK